MIDFDFHIHCAPYSTCASQTAEEAIDCARRAGVETVAFCNHNTVSGLNQIKEICDKKGMRLVSGIEMSVSLKDVTGADDLVLHLLGYGFRMDDKRLADFLIIEKQKHRDRIRAMSEFLMQSGFRISVCSDKKELRRQLCGQEYFQDEKDAKRFLNSKEMQSKFPLHKTEAKTFIDIVHQAGGIVVWAHPNSAENHKKVNIDQIGQFCDVLCGDGLDGIEVFHPNVIQEAGLPEFLLSEAEKRGLKVTLGSDSHTVSKEGEYFTQQNWQKEFDYDYQNIKHFWEE